MSFQLVIPALQPYSGNGLDISATRRYAARAADTWADAFLLSGSTPRGFELTPDERAAVLDLWVEVVEPERLIACCWSSEDIQAAQHRRVRPILVLSAGSRGEALEALVALPAGAFVYSHPRYTKVPFDINVAARAQADGVLPAGAKVSKTSLADLAAIRQATGPGFVLWHGSSRHIAASMAAGADGVVAAPLSVLPQPFPARTVDAVQQMVDDLQVKLHELGTSSEPGERLAALGSMG